jgi:hypothetical protein
MAKKLDETGRWEMRLSDFLELDEQALPSARRAAVDFCEQAWQEFLGRHAEFEKDEGEDPIGAARFRDWFDRLLYDCNRAGFEYPRAYFMRVKQLQDGRWRPPVELLGKTVQ